MTVFTTDPYAIVQTAGETYIGDGTDQVYSINPAMIQAGEVVTIIDQGGTNAIELNAGLEITESIASNNELVLTLSNGAIVNVRGADTFTFNVGQNQAGGDNDGVSYDVFADFAQDILGVTLPAEGADPVEGGASTVNDDGTADLTPVGVPSLSIDDVTVDEGDAGTTTATFTVTLSDTPGAGEEVTVDYATADGTATAGDDYVAATGSLTFAEGETTQTIEVTVNGDTDFEPDETFDVVLSNVAGLIGGEAAVISDATGAGTITNDDEEAVAGETITLTTATDVVGPEGAEGFATTVGDDTIEGVASSLSSTRTLNADDSIDGGDGADTLAVDMQGNFTGFSADGGLHNVETVELTNTGSIARTFNVADVEGVQEYVLNNGNAATNLADLIDAGAEITVNDQEDGNLAIAFDTDSDVVTGTADALSVNLNSVGVADDPDTTTDEEQVVTMTADNIEELALTTTGDNVVDLGSDDAETITVTGEGSLKMAAVGAGLGVFDAESYAGDVDVDLGEASDVTSVVTGDGDDTITADVSDDLTANAEINGGAGQNVLALENTAPATVQYNMANVQTVALGALGGALTFSAANATGIETIAATDDLNENATFASMGGGDLAINLGDNTGNTVTISSDHTGTTTVNAAASEDADANNLEANDLNVSASDSAAVLLNVSEFMDYQGNITAGSAQSIEAQIDGTVTGSSLTLGAASSAVFASEGAVNAALVAANMTDLNITAADDFDLTTTAGTDLSGLESLTVATAGDFEVGGLASVALVDLSGTGSATLGNLGAADMDYGLSVSAAGLGDNLTIGDMLVDAGQSITLEVANVLGDVDLNGQNVTVSQDGTDDTGSITVDADGTTGDVDLGTMQAATVTVEAAGTLGTLDAIITGDNITVNGAGLGVNTLNFTAAETSNVTGGIDNDVLIAQGDGVATVTGDLGDDTFIFAASATDEAFDADLIDTITDFGDADNVGVGTGTADALDSNDTVADVTAGDGTGTGAADDDSYLGFSASATGVQEGLIRIEDNVATFFQDTDTASGATNATGHFEFEDYTPDSLEEALDLLDTHLATGAAVVFEYDDATYLFQAGGTASDMFDSDGAAVTGGDDTVIELQGISADDAADIIFA